MAHSTKIGKGLLEQLMFSLYNDAETIYREYVQNAADAIKDAVRQGVLSAGDGHISINIDCHNSRISIEDNGIGIPANLAESRLKDIAQSSKEADYFAGFYGIGRLVGGGYCRTLTFKTSAKGETVASEMAYNVDTIRDYLNDKNCTLGAAEIIDRAVTFSNSIPEDASKHYFIVTLNGVLPEYPMLLDENAILPYLQQVAPINFDATFKNNCITQSLEKTDKKFTVYYNDLPSVQITLNDYVDIRKLYGLKVAGTNDEIDSLRFFALTDHQYGDLAWGWFAITPFDKAIPNTDPETKQPVLTRGIRLRSHNIQIGNEDFFNGTGYFKQARSNRYFNGEIHIIHSNIKPNTARDGLANTKEAGRLRELIREFFNNEMQKTYQVANKLKKACEKIAEGQSQLEKISRLEDNPTNFPNESKESSIEKIIQKKQSAEEEFQKIVAAVHNSSEGIKKVVSIYQQNAVTATTTDVKNSEEHYISKREMQRQEEDYTRLTEMYGAESVEMVKRIFKILDTHYSGSQKLIQSIKNNIIRTLKRNKHC